MNNDQATSPPSDNGGWTRPRVIFLSITGIVGLILLIAVRQVLLPFILAIIIAYVLTPLVAWCETKLRMPRSLSILVVYSIVIGSVSLAVMSVAPRLYVETLNFVREVPRTAHELAEAQGPSVEKWMRIFQNKPQAAPSPDKRGVVLTKRGDNYELDMGRGILIVEADEGVYRVVSDQPRTQAFNAK